MALLDSIHIFRFTRSTDLLELLGASWISRASHLRRQVQSLGTVPCSSRRVVGQLVLAVHVGVLVALLTDVAVVVVVGVEEVLMRTFASQVRKVFYGI